MAKLTFELREPKKEVSQPINCIVRFGNDKVKFSTGFFIKPSQWNLTEKKPKSRIVLSGKQDIVNRLDSIEEELKKLNSYLINDKVTPTKDFIKQYFEDFMNPKSAEALTAPEETPKQKLFRLIGEFIENSKNGIRKNHDGEKLKPRSIQRYNTVHDRLLEFSKIYDRELSLTTIDEAFHIDYVEWLESSKNLAKNTIWKDVTTIKSIMNHFLEEGLISTLPYRTKKFKAVEEESDTIYLTVSELEKIQNLDLSNSQRLERVRDFFIVGCNTGLRYSDLSKVNKYSFIKDEDGTEFIQITQQKTGEPVTVPVLHVVKGIFEKYNYQLPTISNQKVNDYIKEVCQMAEIKETVQKQITKGGKKITTDYEKWQLVTDHTARRSFATNSYKDGISLLVIMAITGHKTEKSFMKYIKLNDMEKAKRYLSDWNKAKDKRDATNETILKMVV